MATGTPLGDNHFKLLLKYGDETIGYFDYETIKKGTEGGELSRDPEAGTQLRAGLDTADAFDISRDWLAGRDRKTKVRCEQLKNGPVLKGYVFEYDPITKAPTESEPLETLDLMIREVSTPKGSAKTSEGSRLVVNVEPKP